MIATNINKMLTEKPVVTPRGNFHWVKVNSRYDEYEGKRKYKIAVSFDKSNEAKMKAYCDKLLAKAKTLPEFQDKKWMSDAQCGYKEQDDGTLYFMFQTNAFYTDRDTGEDKQRVIPVIDTTTRKKVDKDVSIAEGSEGRISFTPGAYWSSARSNGVNLYLNKIAVDKLVEFNNDDDFSEFGIELASDADDFSDMACTDEEIPV